LDTVASILRRNVYLKLDISGHTDSTGDEEKNKILSSNRAQAVLDYLITKGRLSRSSLTAVGYGSERPVADNKNPEGRKINRRVDMKLRY
ncbi:OmpA family protein, partial [Nostoc sp. PA-18-2419]|uniref:OmpA family protein n=1 Tax=Nostoc sp. PA-18-2419 TaxID=2575443 RepID=UPI001109D327